MARDFNGTTDEISLGDVLDYTAASLSFLAWIFPRTEGELGLGRIVEKIAGATGYNWLLDSGGMDLSIGATVVSSTGGVTLGVWQHVAVIYDGANARFYVNGVEKGAPALTAVPSDSTELLRIGNRAANDRTFDGRIAELCFYDHALTATEIQTVRLQGPLALLGGLRAWWPLHGELSPEPDLSGNNNHGTVSGAVRGDHPPGYALWGTASQEAKVTLPGTDADLATVWSTQNYADIGRDDAVRVGLTGSGYLIHQFKDKNPNGSDLHTVTWNGQSDLAPSGSPVFLQVYNRTLAAWETVATEGAAAANTDFTLIGRTTGNPADYFDASFWTSWRVYQAA